MTPADHYLEAERLLDVAKTTAPGQPASRAPAYANTIAAAQAHATLALVGAVALSAVDDKMTRLRELIDVVAIRDEYRPASALRYTS